MPPTRCYPNCDVSRIVTRDFRQPSTPTPKRKENTMSDLPPTPANLHGTATPSANLPREEKATSPHPDWVAKEDATNPNHYRGFSHGSEVIDITENLSFNGGNVVKYAARATRMDAGNKSGTLDGQIQDLEKARWYVDRELRRLRLQRETEQGAIKW